MAPEQLIEHLRGTESTVVTRRRIIISAVIESVRESVAIILVVIARMVLMLLVVVARNIIRHSRLQQVHCTIIRIRVAVIIDVRGRRRRMTADARATEQTKVLLRCLAKDSPV